MLSVSPTSASERCGLRRPARGLAVGAGAVVRVVVVALGVVTGWSRCPGSRGGVVVAVVLVVGVRFWGLRLATGFGICGETWGGRGAATTSVVAALAAARREQWVQLLEQAAPGPWRLAEPTQRWPRCWIGCGAGGACHPVCRRYGLVGVSAPARVAVEGVVVAAVVVVDAVLAVEVTEVEGGRGGWLSVGRWRGVRPHAVRWRVRSAAVVRGLRSGDGLHGGPSPAGHHAGRGGFSTPVLHVRDEVLRRCSRCRWETGASCDGSGAARSLCPTVAARTRGAAMAVHVEGEEVGEVEVQGSGSSPS